LVSTTVVSTHSPACRHPVVARDLHDPLMDLLNHLRRQRHAPFAHGLGVGRLGAADAGEITVHQIGAHLPFQHPVTPVARRSVKLRVLEIARAARTKGHQNSERLAQAYRKLLEATGRVVGQARRFAKEIDNRVKRAAEGSREPVLDGLRRELENMLPLVQQVMRQTKARVLAGDTHAEGKIVSLFEPTTEVIHKGKAGKPTEFGKMVKLQEAENQIVIAMRSTISGPATLTY
jgi:hypothetical protein